MLVFGQMGISEFNEVKERKILTNTHTIKESFQLFGLGFSHKFIFTKQEYE